MDITSSGFAGSVDEAQWAFLASLLGTRYAVGSAADFKATAVAGQRQVSIAPGKALGKGVLASALTAGIVNLGTPNAGQWYLIVLRRDWTAKTIATVAIAASTTSSAVPTVPPTVLPSLNQNAGTLDDQLICWAWVRSTTTEVVIFDLRTLPLDDRVVATSSALAGSGSKALALRLDTDNSMTLTDTSSSTNIFVVDSTGTITAGKMSWSQITNVPNTFPPSGHTHPVSQISDAGAVGANVLTSASQTAALNALGIYVQAAAPANVAGRVWIKSA